MTIRSGEFRLARICAILFAVLGLSMVTVSVASAGILDDLIKDVEDVIDEQLGNDEPAQSAPTETPDPSPSPSAEPAPTGPADATAPADPVPQQSTSSTVDKPTAAQAMEVQDRLNRLGYDAGPVDGQPGPRTRTAITVFQRNNGLPADGKISSELLAALRSATADASTTVSGGADPAAPEVVQTVQASSNGGVCSALKRVNSLTYDQIKTEGRPTVDQYNSNIVEMDDIAPGLTKCVARETRGIKFGIICHLAACTPGADQTVPADTIVREVEQCVGHQPVGQRHVSSWSLSSWSSQARGDMQPMTPWPPQLANIYGIDVSLHVDNVTCNLSVAVR